MDEENKAVEEAQEEKPVEEVKTEEVEPEKKGGSPKAFLTIIAIILFVVLIGRMTRNKPSTTTPTETPTPTEEVLIYEVGQAVKLGSATITVNKFEFSKGTTVSKPAEGNEWLNINITVANEGTTQQTLTTLGQMFVKDEEGNTYQVAVTDKTLANLNQRLDGTILANGKRTGWVGFEIKKDAAGLKFQYNAGLFGGGNIVVKLER